MNSKGREGEQSIILSLLHYTSLLVSKFGGQATNAWIENVERVHPLPSLLCLLWRMILSSMAMFGRELPLTFMFDALLERHLG